MKTDKDTTRRSKGWRPNHHHQRKKCQKDARDKKKKQQEKKCQEIGFMEEGNDSSIITWCDEQFIQRFSLIGLQHLLLFGPFLVMTSPKPNKVHNNHNIITKQHHLLGEHSAYTGRYRWHIMNTIGYLYQ